MSVSWISRQPKSWNGHVFLEVHLASGWALLDASELVLYRDYTTAARILPGNRYATGAILSVDGGSLAR